MRLLLHLLLAGCPALAQWGQLINSADWYVDSVTGSDSNNGQLGTGNVPQPFATIAHAMAQSVTSGKTIGLAAGSRFRETLTVPVDSLTVLGYGSGASPIIDGMDVIAGGSWSKTGGQTNVYQISATMSATSAFVNLLENGVILPRATSLANCDSTAGSAYATAETGAITLYVHTSDSANPASNGKTYEYSQRDFVLDGRTRQYLKVIGVTTRGGNNNFGSMTLGRYSTVLNSAANDGPIHNIYANSGARLSNTTMNESYCGPGCIPIVFVAFDVSAAGSAARCTDCTITISTSPNNPSPAGFTCHTSGGPNFTDFTLSGVQATGVSGLAGGANVSQLVIQGSAARRSSVTMATSGFTSGNAVQCSAPSCTVKALDVIVSSMAGASAVQLPVNNVTAIIDDLAVTSTVSPKSTLCVNTGYQSGLNVTLTNSNLTGCQYAVWAGAVTTLNLQHNSVSGIGSQVYHIESGSTSLASDYNAFNGSTAWLFGPLYSTFASWQATGQDAHSTQ